jgi:alpha-glucoside transport system substrate-binding protein
MDAGRPVMTVRRVRALGAVAVATAAVVVSTACFATSGAPEANLEGSTLEVLGSWSGVEQQRFEQVLRQFEHRTGAAVHYISADRKVTDMLTSRLARHDPPDVAFLPQPGQLRAYAAAAQILPLDPATVDLVDANYPSTWRELASYDGRMYGVWFKAANKSLIWYNVATFERLGVAPPSDVAQLLDVARRLARTQTPAFAVAGGDSWTLSDWFENLYLRVAGPQRYDQLAAHSIPWTDGSVVRTLGLLAELFAPEYLAGGVPGAQRMTFEESIDATFDTPPRAAMVAEGDFVAAQIVGDTDAQLAVDADVFPFPAVDGSPPTVVGGGDVAVLMRPSRAGAAFLRYLAGADAATIWATDGGFVSPNVNVDLSVYPDTLTRSIARGLLEAGDGFRFDLSDLEPAEFGGSDRQGLLWELHRFLSDRDPAATAARLEQTAQAVMGAVGVRR